MKRSIIRIDQDKCDGCGQCVPGCAEGALKIVDGKARLVKDSYCDGLGACLGACPRNALTIEEREAEAFSLPEVHQGCPGSMARPSSQGNTQWPLQLRLVPAGAPFWKNADLLIAADCVPPAFPDFHNSLLRGRKLIIACPKLDDTTGYLEKLSEIIRENELCSLTVAKMEVPCCAGLERLAAAAVKASGKDLPLNVITIGVDGRLK